MFFWAVQTISHRSFFNELVAFSPSVFLLIFRFNTPSSSRVSQPKGGDCGEKVLFIIRWLVRDVCRAFGSGKRFHAVRSVW